MGWRHGPGGRHQRAHASAGLQRSKDTGGTGLGELTLCVLTASVVSDNLVVRVFNQEPALKRRSG